MSEFLYFEEGISTPQHIQLVRDEGKIYPSKIVLQGGRVLTTAPFNTNDYLAGNVIFMKKPVDIDRLIPIDLTWLNVLHVEPEFDANLNQAITSVNAKLNIKIKELERALAKIQNITDPATILQILRQINLENIIPVAKINFTGTHNKDIVWNIVLINPSTNKAVKLKCVIDTKADYNIIDANFSDKLGLAPLYPIMVEGAVGEDEIHQVVKLKIQLLGEILEIEAIRLPNAEKKFNKVFASGQELINWYYSKKGIKLSEE